MSCTKRNNRFIYFMSRINNYVRNGQKENLVDPTAERVYVKTKELRVQVTTKSHFNTTMDTATIFDSNLCLKGEI